MANATLNADSPPAGSTARTRGLSARAALVVAVLAGIGATGATMLLLTNRYTLGIEAFLAVAALVAFGVAVYGLIQSVLAIVDTAGERRRQEREVSERRKGARARKPVS